MINSCCKLPDYSQQGWLPEEKRIAKGTVWTCEKCNQVYEFRQPWHRFPLVDSVRTVGSMLSLGFWEGGWWTQKRSGSQTVWEWVALVVLLMPFFFAVNR